MTQSLADLLIREPVQLFAESAHSFLEAPTLEALWTEIGPGDGTCSARLGQPLKVRCGDGTSLHLSASWSLVGHESELLEGLFSALPTSAGRWQRGQELVAAVAHELNNVLAPLMLLLPELRDGETAGLLDDFEGAIERAAGLVQHLEWIARATQVAESARQPFPSQIWAHELAKSLRSQKDLRVLFEIVGEPPALTGDPSILFRLFKSLGREISTLPGGLDLRLILRVGSEPSTAALEVEAPGVRLNAREKHALFAGADLPTTTHRSLLFATRLLSAVLAESGGRLEPGNSKGLSLRAVLAASGAPVPKSKVDQGTDTRRNPSSQQPMTILVADDESKVRRVLELTLTRRGHKVLQASDGSGAIKIFRKDHETIDLVLSDLSMPGLSGIEILRRLQEIDAKVPIVVMSGSVNERDRIAEAAPFVSGVLSKPFGTTTLLSALGHGRPARKAPRVAARKSRST
jgi:CheY-like chemotaxis protein